MIRRPIRIVEIVQPLCSRTFGVSPCEAAGTPCWNTDDTCRYRQALDMTMTLPLRFVEDLGWPWQEEPNAFQPALAMPALQRVDYSPTVLNVAGGSSDASPLGLRAVCTVVVRDFPHNDAFLDPYRAARDYDPAARGTFWGKWLARNPRHVDWRLRVYEGELGQALDDMIRREYRIERIVLAGGAVSITAKDILRKITDTGVMAPAVSPGLLASAIGAGDGSLTIAGAVETDYPAPGRVRIGDEVIGYAATGLSGSNVQLTGLTRGVRNTVANAHSQGERVQWVLSYALQPYTDILHDLITVRAGIDAVHIDKPAWDQEYTLWRPTYLMERDITQPTPVETLAAELCLQSLSYIWWDERAQRIEHRAMRPDFWPETLTEGDNIVLGSFSLAEHPDQRVSEVWVYYGLRSPVHALGDKASYARVEVAIDVLKAEQYAGERQIREIFAPWIATGPLALTLATTYLGRFREVRRTITFSVAAKDITEFWTGRSCHVEHFAITDHTGAPRVGNWLITSAEPVEVGAIYKFVAEDNDASGVLWLWQDEATAPADWWAATPEERETIPFWLDEDGLDPGGTPRPWRWL